MSSLVESQLQRRTPGRFHNGNRGLRGREGRKRPHLSPDPEASGIPKAEWVGGRAVEEGLPDSPNSRASGRERRQGVLIPRLLSGDHPSAPPGTLSPDCPPPAGSLQIALARGEGALRHHCGRGDLGRPQAALGPSPPPSSHNGV